MTVRHLQPSFTGGEISRRLQARVDTAIYPIALAGAVNVVAAVEGPVCKRPGTRFRGAAPADAAWLSAFVPSATQAYVLAWGNGRVRFFTNGAPVLAGDGAPLEIAVPYADDALSALSTQQSHDVLYLAHPDHPPAELRRTGANQFEYRALTLDGGPFAERNATRGREVQASGTTGQVTLTATADLFAPGHVGALMRIEVEDFADIEAWQPGMSPVIIGDQRRAEGRVYTALTAGRTGNVQPIHSIGIEWDGERSAKDINDKGPYGVQWAYRHDRFGIVRIDAVTGPRSAEATVLRRLPDGCAAAPTWRWAHGLFSTAAGWPQLVALWRGRLVFVKNRDLVASTVGDYRDFAEFDEAGERVPDMGFRRTIEAPERPIWARADRQSLLLGTIKGEYLVTALNPSELVSGTNIGIVPQSFHGSAPVEPVQTASETLFVQRGRRKIRAGAYSMGQDRYIARNLTLYARHITRAGPSGGIVQMAYQAEPEELLWALRSDGVVIAHPYAPDQEAKGWTRALALESGRVLSIVAVPSEDASADDLWLLVDRDGVRSVEQLARWWDEDAGLAADDGCFVDAAVSYRGPPETDFAGLEHLTGRSIMVLADGAEIHDVVVDALGRFTLERAARRVTAGLPYTAWVETLEPELPRRDGTSQGLKSRAVRMLARLIDSAATMGGTVSGQLQRLMLRAAPRAMGAGPLLFSGLTESVALDSTHGTARVRLEDRSPFPWILPAIVTEIEAP